MKLEQGNFPTAKHHEVNSIIMEIACEYADYMTRVECIENGMPVDQYHAEDSVCITYTDEAQDIFNHHYDIQMDKLYAFVNTIAQIIIKK